MSRISEGRIESCLFVGRGQDLRPGSEMGLPFQTQNVTPRARLRETGSGSSAGLVKCIGGHVVVRNRKRGEKMTRI